MFGFVLHSALKLTLGDFMAKGFLHRLRLSRGERQDFMLHKKKTSSHEVKNYQQELSLFYSIAIPEKKRSNDDRNPFLHRHLSLISRC